MGFFAWAAVKIDELIHEYRFETLYMLEEVKPPTHNKPTDISKEIAQMGPNAIEYLEKKYHEGNANERMRVVFNLQSFTDPCAIPLLIEALQDENADIAGSAITPLGKWGSAAVPALIGLVSDNNKSCFDARLQAIAILGSIGDRRATGTLIGCLADESLDVREYSISALKMLRDESAVPALAACLYDSNQFVQARAASAFIEMPDERAIPGLLELIDSHVDGVKENAEKALVSIGISALPAVFEKTVMIFINEPATDVIIEMGAPAIPYLIKKLEDNRWEKRCTASSLLGRIEEGKKENAVSTSALAGMLSDANPKVRKFAADALVLIQNIRGIRPLWNTMKQDPDLDVRTTAMTDLVIVAEANMDKPENGRLILPALYDVIGSYEYTGSRTHVVMTINKCLAIFAHFAKGGEEIGLQRLSSSIKAFIYNAKHSGEASMTQRDIERLSSSYMDICEIVRSRKSRLFDDGEIISGIALKAPKGTRGMGMFRSARSANAKVMA